MKLPTESRKHYRKLVDDFGQISKHMLEIAESFGELLKTAFDELDEAERLLVAARDRMKCERSGNPCNTDTRVIGAPPCCESCRVHRRIVEHFRP